MPLPRNDPLSLRSARRVMRLRQMGVGWAMRLSFARQLIRRMCGERWEINCAQFDIDSEGRGTAQYRANTGARVYTLIGFSHPIAEAEAAARNDRVIANEWDSTFVLFDGIPTGEDVQRCEENAPRQEAGRFRASELVLTRANKSVRVFSKIVEALSAGQPLANDDELLLKVGYLMRTTAVYGNGKFGIADRAKYQNCDELRAPFQAEMLAVYLIRLFTFDLVEHLARCRNPQTAIRLPDEHKQFLGVGNATGLGMAPFLIHHPRLLHQWVSARETAYARALSQQPSNAHRQRFMILLQRAALHIQQWQPEDMAQLLKDCAAMKTQLKKFPAAQAWHEFVSSLEDVLSLAGQELLLSIVLELYPDAVDDLAATMHDDESQPPYDPCMRLSQLQVQLDSCEWLQRIDDAPSQWHYFWYYSETKMEPRLGQREHEAGADKEMSLTVAHQLKDLQQQIPQWLAAHGDITLAHLLRVHPEARLAIHRAFVAAAHPYSEIQDNVVASDMRPIDLLRFKLSFFGATKFDPKSDLWLRINLFQGAPLPHQFAHPDADDWCFPVLV